MKKLLNQLMLCATLVFMSISMSSCLTTMGLMLIWLDDDEPQQQQQAPVEKIYSDFEFHVKEVKKGTLDGDFINKLTMKGDGGGIQYISSDPSVATIDASGRVHILKTGTTSITATIEDRGNYIYNNHAATYTILVTEGYTYVEYDPTTKKFKTNVLESADKYTLLSSLGSGDITLNETSKPYLANSDITINGTITFANDAKLILVDGCVVTVNGKVTVSSAIDDINIYGQTWMNGSGLLNVKSTTDDAINCNNLQLHSCYVRVETTGSGKKGIYAANYIGFYGCLAQGNGCPDGDGIFCGGNMDIVESFIVGSGGSNNAGNGGHGIVIVFAWDFFVVLIKEIISIDVFIGVELDGAILAIGPVKDIGWVDEQSDEIEVFVGRDIGIGDILPGLVEFIPLTSDTEVVADFVSEGLNGHSGLGESGDGDFT